MSWISKFIGEVTGNAGTKRARQRQRDSLSHYEEQLSSSNRKIHDLIAEQAKLSEERSGVATGERTSLEKQLTDYIASISGQNRQSTSDIMSGLETRNKEAIAGAGTNLEDILSRASGGIEGEFSRVSPEIEKLLSNRESSTTSALDKALSAEQTPLSNDLISLFASRGHDINSPAIRAELANALSKQNMARFGLTERLQTDRYGALMDQLLGRQGSQLGLNNLALSLRSGLGNMGLQTQLGTNQMGAGLSREDYLTQKTKEYNDYIQRLAGASGRESTMSDIRNRYQYDIPLNALQNAEAGNLGLEGTKLNIATQAAQDAAARSDMYKNMLISGATSIVSPTLGGLGNYAKESIFGQEKDPYAELYKQYFSKKVGT